MSNDNFMDNGAVLPSGLLSVSSQDQLEGFRKTFQNPYLKVGIVIKTYDISDENNLTKLVPEYDVLVFEQMEDRGATVITYKNCLAGTSFGSIADFFEAKIRHLEKKTTRGPTPSPAGQDGSIVLLLCLNGLSDRGVIIGALSHPDRKTTLTEPGPRLEGEYNGINIKVEKDGSTSLTFRGATDNQGEVIDEEQGDTVMSIEKDGSYQIQHETVTMRLDKKGEVTITGTDNLTINCKDANITASGNITAKCVDAMINASGTATVEGETVKLGKDAMESVIKGDTFKKMVFDTHIHPTPIGPSGPPSVPMSPNSLSKKVKTE